MAERTLEKYRDEILTMRKTQRFTLAQIRDYLEEKYGVMVPKSTLQAYVKSLPEAQQPVPEGEPRVSPEEQQFFAQREVFDAVRGMAEDVLRAMSEVMGRLQVIEDAAAERMARLEAGMRDLHSRPVAGGMPSTGALERIETSVKTLESRMDAFSMQVIDPAIVRSIQKRAAWVTGIACFLLFAGVVYVIGPWVWGESAKAAAPPAVAPATGKAAGSKH